MQITTREKNNLKNQNRSASAKCADEYHVIFAKYDLANHSSPITTLFVIAWYFVTRHKSYSTDGIVKSH